MDNIFIERLYKTVNYEEVYLNAYESISHVIKEHIAISPVIGL